MGLLLQQIQASLDEWLTAFEVCCEDALDKVSNANLPAGRVVIGWDYPVYECLKCPIDFVPSQHASFLNEPYLSP